MHYIGFDPQPGDDTGDGTGDDLGDRVGDSTNQGNAQTFTAVDPRTDTPLGPAYREASAGQVDAALRKAAAAFAPFGQKSPAARAAFLRAIATEIESLGDALLTLTHQETALPLARLTGERARTAGQLRLFADVVEDGSHLGVRIDTARPDRKPLPGPDLRQMLVPLGPVVVFGASNFPYAFSVAGGDTASALAAGCPVVVKAHPAHPGTSALLAGAVTAAARATGMPDGVFSLLHGRRPKLSIDLVTHPLATAVGFTGSLKAGRAIFDAAAARPVPIPVYAEMGSVNPLFLLDGALGERATTLAAGALASVTLGCGQFCTNPGLIVAVRGRGLSAFVAEYERLQSAATAGTMLTPALREAFEAGLARMRETPGVETVRSTSPAHAATTPAALLRVSAGHFLATPHLAEELFGPATLVVMADSPDELLAVAGHLAGQLTATLHATHADLRHCSELIQALQQKVGRLIFNGYPTGVEVAPAMQHGGPYPASSDVRSTSVGTAAVLRFLRPICLQDCPPDLLPAELQDENPRKLMRMVDGVYHC